jgi:hypothetical protein
MQRNWRLAGRRGARNAPTAPSKVPFTSKRSMPEQHPGAPSEANTVQWARRAIMDAAFGRAKDAVPASEASKVRTRLQIHLSNARKGTMGTRRAHTFPLIFRHRWNVPPEKAWLSGANGIQNPGQAFHLSMGVTHRSGRLTIYK